MQCRQNPEPSLLCLLLGLVKRLLHHALVAQLRPSTRACKSTTFHSQLPIRRTLSDPESVKRKAGRFSKQDVLPLSRRSVAGQGDVMTLWLQVQEGPAENTVLGLSSMLRF